MKAGRTVLVADDEPGVREVLRRGLGAPGCRVLAARDGEEALTLAREGEPDVVLLDLNMPKLDGWAVLRALREGARTRLLPIIMLTHAGSVQDRVGGLERGADDYVTKPFSLAELRARVDGVLRRHRESLHASPLTGLPGNPAIEEEVERRIDSGEPFALFHADIDRFKAFNDARGFAAGDMVLRETADMARAAAGTHFAGHIGGDDFALVTDATDAPHVAQRLVTLFDERAPVWARPVRARPLTLSVGIATTTRRSFSSYRQAAAAASEMKAYLKARPAALSRFAFDRRDAGGEPVQG
ncbi:MAG: response regulator [Actinomycetota bacterium]